jgi:hypothetical protein
MERLVPAGVRREIDRQESPEVYIIFLRIDHPSLVEPLRVVADPVDHLFDGHIWSASPLQIGLLTDTDAPPSAELKMQNVDRRVGQVLFPLEGAPELEIIVVAGSEFDQTTDPRTEIGAATVTYRAKYLKLVNVTGDALEMTGRLISFDYTQEGFAIWATQDRLPGLYR